MGAQFLHLACQGGGSPFASLSVKPLTLMCVWLSFQTKDLFAALRLPFYVNYKRLLHLMAIFRSLFSDSTRVLALCQVCQKHLAYEKPQGKNLMLSDVEEGNNLMLTRLTPVATSTDTKQQSATTRFQHTNSNVFVTFVQ